MTILVEFHVWTYFTSLGHMSSVCVGKWMFIFVRDWEPVFQGGCPILRSRQQCLRDLAPRTPHPAPALDILSIFNYPCSNRHAAAPMSHFSLP